MFELVRIFSGIPLSTVRFFLPTILIAVHGHWHDEQAVAGQEHLPAQQKPPLLRELHEILEVSA